MKPAGSRQRSEGCLAATARRATCRRYRSGSWISASENESSMNCRFLHSPCQVWHIYSVSRRTWLSLVGVLFILLWVLSTQFPFLVSGTKSCAFRPSTWVWRASPRGGADDARMPTSPGVVTWMLCGDHDAASQETRGSRAREGCWGAFEKRHQFIQLATQSWRHGGAHSLPPQHRTLLVHPK